MFCCFSVVDELVRSFYRQKALFVVERDSRSDWSGWKECGAWEGRQERLFMEETSGIYKSAPWLVVARLPWLRWQSSISVDLLCLNERDMS